MTRVSDYLYRKASVNKIPLSGCFELSPICNFSCKMCYVRKTEMQLQKAGKRLIDWKQWISLAEKCHQEGTLYLLLTGGEPFLYPHFKELYLHLHQMGFVISINTNGYLIDDNVIKWLKDAAPSKINITLYGASDDTYRKLCGCEHGFQTVIKAISSLKSAGIALVLNASMIPENADDLEKIMEIGKQFEIPVRMSTYMFPPVRRDREKDDSRFTPEMAAKMYMKKLKCQFDQERYQKVVLQQLDEIGSIEKKDDEDWGQCDEYMRCRAGRSSFWVSWDGMMSACGMTPFPVEVNPFQRDFRDCWMELTDRVRCTPVLKECQLCRYRPICNPCVAMLYAETGDVNQRSSYLCEMSKQIEKRLIDEKGAITNED